MRYAGYAAYKQFILGGIQEVRKTKWQSDSFVCLTGNKRWELCHVFGRKTRLILQFLNNIQITIFFVLVLDKCRKYIQLKKENSL